MATLGFETCMDIFDWFDDNQFDYLSHILVSKLDGEQRISRAMPEIRKRARWLLNLHRNTECAYPEEYLEEPA